MLVADDHERWGFLDAAPSSKIGPLAVVDAVESECVVISAPL
jgi:hypothetical protein